MRLSRSHGSSLTSSLFQLGFLSVPVYDTLCVNAEGCLRRLDRLEQQVICDGFRFPHR